MCPLTAKLKTDDIRGPQSDKAAAELLSFADFSGEISVTPSQARMVPASPSTPR